MKHSYRPTGDASTLLQRIRKTVLLCIVIGASWLLTTCSKQPGSEYFPALSKRASYEYSLEYTTLLSGIQKGQMVVRREDQETINGKQYDKQVTIYSGIPGAEADVAYYRRTPTGIYKIDGKHKDRSEYLDTPFPITVGSTWISDGPDARVRWQAVSVETLELIDRRYDKCMKVSFATEKAAQSFEGTEYLAPGIGMVKGSLRISGLATTTFEFTLQKYKQ